MHSKRSVSLSFTVFVLLASSLACSLFAPQSPTAPPPQQPPPQQPTAAPTEPPQMPPTATQPPAATPDVEATARYEDFYATLQRFAEKGYIPTTEGEIIELEPFQKEWAQLNWYQWWPFEDMIISTFVFQGHFKWSTASATPDISGCGIVFGLQSNNDHYAIFLDSKRILVVMARGSSTYEVGKTRGSGRTNFGNPAEADFAVAVHNQKAYVSVNGDITEYTLSADQTTQGQFALTLLSGTNKDYGTRCEMSNMFLWTPK